jgi:predicted small lipoprotein YifL
MSGFHTALSRTQRAGVRKPCQIGRAIAAIVLSVAVALPLAACGKKGPLDPPPPKEEKHKKEEQAAPAQ